jgi:C4-dicarboxylate-specific signal transduction histidine kinase
MRGYRRVCSAKSGRMISRNRQIKAIGQAEQSGFEASVSPGMCVSLQTANDGLRNSEQQLAHANRVGTMAQLAGSIAHEVNQPIGATVNHARAALHFLDRQPPDLQEVRDALMSIVEAGHHAGDVIDRIRGLVKKAPSQKERLQINGLIREVIELTHGEAVKRGALVKTDLAEDLPLVPGDRVQMQQVLLNLIANAFEAMSASEGTRELLISTRKDEKESVRVALRDSGPGLGPTDLERVFEPFYTTKPSGLGMGLSICRSIIEAHGGRPWATANVPPGAVCEFTLPPNPDAAR